MIVFSSVLLGCGEAARYDSANRGANAMANAANSFTDLQKQKTQIVNDQFPVNAGEYRYYEFNVGVPSFVSGGFVAYGGSNDIDVILVDDQKLFFINE